MTADCTTLYCPRPGTVPGIFRTEEFRDGPEVDHHVTYCRECARSMHADGYFFPANEEDVAPTPELTEEELAIVERFETAPPVCLSCDQYEDTITRLLTLADDLDGFVAARGEPAKGSFDHALNMAQAAVASEIRAAVKGAA